MERIIANLSGRTRRAKLQGRDYIVAPLTLIVPGVLNGSQGPLYYPPEEIAKNPGVWNGVPIVVDHPTHGGQPVSARDPDVLNKQSIGQIFRSKAEGKLTAEGWFDLEAVERVDNRVLQDLEASKKIELSTGLFTDNEVAPEGSKTDSGEAYTHTARNYRPDHLAILSDQVGACSINDGCGVNVNAHDLSHDDLRNLLQTKLTEKLGSKSDDVWIVEVFDDFFVYRRDDKLFSLGYGVSKEEVLLSEEQPTEVKRVTTFEPVANIDKQGNSSKGESDMAGKLSDESRKKMIDGLIANSCCWNEDEREFLNELTDGGLGHIHTQAEKQETVLNTALEDKTKWESKAKELELVVNQKSDEPSTKDDKPLTEEQWLAKTEAPPSVREDLEFARNEKSKQKSEVIDLLVVNISDEEKQNQRKRLEGRSLEDLRGDLALLPEKQREVVPAANYAGAAASAGVANRGEKDFAPFGLPHEYIEEKSVGV